MAKDLHGIVHVHSSYSYDGRHSLQEIRDTARRRGLDFACITEHSDTLDAATVHRFAAECDRLSTTEFLLVPGIEFTCDDELHLMGIGIREYTDATDPVQVTEFIRRLGGIAVIAHPMRKRYRMPPDLLARVDGVEVWNCGYDGRFFPNARAIDFYAATRARNPGLLAFSGVDMHRLSNLHSTCVRLTAEACSEASVLQALRAGNFSGESPWCHVSARPRWGRAQRYHLHLMHGLYRYGRRLKRALGVS